VLPYALCWAGLEQIHWEGGRGHACRVRRQALHPSPYTSPYTLHPTPYTLHPTPCTLHTLLLTPYAASGVMRGGAWLIGATPFHNC
jgi:hypothetical protein